MQYSNTTTKDGLLQHCEMLGGFGDGTITIDTTTLKPWFTGALNRAFQKVVSTILTSQDDWDFDDVNNTDYAVATTDLVAGQRDYSFPASLKLLKIKRVDVSYNGHFYKATPIDSSALGFGLGNDTDTDGNFNASEPCYDAKANAVWIYPLPPANVTAGLRVEFTREPNEFATSDTTKEPGIDEPFHPMLSIHALYEWAVANDLSRADRLMATYLEYEARLKAHYGSKQQDEPYILKGPGTNYD